MATRKPIKQVGKPTKKIMSSEELGADVRQANELLRKHRSNEATRARRIAKVNQEFDKRATKVDKDLDPLLDKILTYVLEHWDELALASSPETVKLSDVDFKRHIDTEGTKVVDDKQVIAFIQNLPNNDMLETLRKVHGEDVVSELISQLKNLVTKQIVAFLDSNTLKQMVKEHPELNTIPGFEVNYTDTVKMIPHRSAVEVQKKKPSISEVRAIPASDS